MLCVCHAISCHAKKMPCHGATVVNLSAFNTDTPQTTRSDACSQVDRVNDRKDSEKDPKKDSRDIVRRERFRQYSTAERGQRHTERFNRFFFERLLLD